MMALNHAIVGFSLCGGCTSITNAIEPVLQRHSGKQKSDRSQVMEES